jgi:predicted double-glycine peptidase
MLSIQRQSHPTTCGFAALGTLLNALGDRGATEQTLIDEWRRMKATGGEPDDLRAGVSIGDLRELARARGHVATAIRVRAQSVSRLDYPVLVRLNRPSAPPHIVVLKGMSGGDAHLADPALGHVREDQESFFQQWAEAESGEGVLLVIGDPHKPLPADSPLSAARSGIETPRVIEALVRYGARLRMGEQRATLEVALRNATSTYAGTLPPRSGLTLEGGGSITVEYGVTDTLSVWGRLPFEKTRRQIRSADGDEIADVNARTRASMGFDSREVEQFGGWPAVVWGLNLAARAPGAPAAVGGHIELSQIFGRSQFSIDTTYSRQIGEGDSLLATDRSSLNMTATMRTQVFEGLAIWGALRRDLMAKRTVGANDINMELGADVALGPLVFVRGSAAKSFSSLRTRGVGLSIGISFRN